MKLMNCSKLIISFAIILQAVQAFSQERVPVLDKGSIEAQFNEVIDKSSTYQEYRVIKAYWLSTFKSHLTDSLNKFKKQLASTRTLFAASQSRIDSLANELQRTKSELETIRNAKDSIPFLFFSMGKNAYNRLMWTLMGVIILVLVFFIVLYNRSKIVINQAWADLEEKKEEFEAFRKRALERESQLSRNYLNELNKYRNNPNLK
jgi:hypothetical protein